MCPISQVVMDNEEDYTDLVGLDDSIYSWLCSQVPSPPSRSNSSSSNSEETSTGSDSSAEFPIFQTEVNRRGLLVRHKMGEYRILETADSLKRYCNKRVNNIALQFPDSLLPEAPFVFNILSSLLSSDGLIEDGLPEEEERNFFVYVLGDTSYGECCVDEVAAQHLDTDVVVHYGPACLSPTRTLPVLYVIRCFESLEVQRSMIGAAKKELRTLGAMSDIDQIIIMYDLELYEFILYEQFFVGCDDDEMYDPDIRELSHYSYGKPVQVAKLRIRDVNSVQPPTKDSKRGHGNPSRSKRAVGHLQYDEKGLTYSRTGVIWFSVANYGDSESDNVGISARNAALLFCSGSEPCTHFEVIPIDTSLTSTLPAQRIELAKPKVDVSRVLRKRFAQLQGLEDAKRIGVVAGTLGVSGNTEIIERCVRVIEHVGKHAYILLVGKLNDVKLGNFPDLDAFVLVACARNSIVDAELMKKVQQPIVTPRELEAALLGGGDIFSEPYSLDFADVLATRLVLDEREEGENVEGDKKGEDAKGTVANRGEWSLSVNDGGGGADFLRERSWKGLTYDRGGRDNETPIEELGVDVVEGQHGMASRYDREAAAASRRTGPNLNSKSGSVAK